MDGLVAVWTVLWLVLAGWTAYSVWVFADVGQTMASAGDALDSAGVGLQRVGELPLVGDTPTELGDQVRATAGEIIQQGQAATGEVRRLAVLLGISIFFIPVTPILGLWGPLRWARWREVRAMQSALRDHGTDVALLRYLAGRAVDRIPYSTLRGVSEDPRGDLDDGRWHRLASLELDRLGLDRRLLTSSRRS